MLSGLDKLLIATLTLVLMVGMGASLTAGDYRRALERPRAILIGLLSQFGWMTLLAYLAIRSLGLEGNGRVGSAAHGMRFRRQREQHVFLFLACGPGVKGLDDRAVRR